MKLTVLLLLLSSVLSAQTVQGNVFDALTGAPVAGAIVSVQGSGMDRMSGRTDAAGHFQVAGTGFSLQVSRAGYLSTSRDGLVGKRDQPISEQRISLVPQAVISGKLTDEEGFPVEGALVVALRYQMVKGERKLEPAGGMVQTDDLGAYRIARLPAGRYYVRADPGMLAGWDRRYMPEYYPGSLQPSTDSFIEVKAGEERGNIDLHFTKHEGVTVEGRMVLADGVATPKMWPHVYLTANEFGMGAYFALRQSSEGAFRIPHVPPGAYTLRAASGNEPPKAGDLFGEQHLQVTDTGIRDLALTVRELKPMDVPGTILLEDGHPPQAMIINARPTTGRGATARSNDEGAFTLAGLLPGHYDLQVAPQMSLSFDSLEAMMAAKPSHAVSARQGDKEVLQSGFDLDGPSAPPLTITVSNRWYEVKGKLLDTSSQPLADAVIEIDSGQPGGCTAAVTDADGAFRLFPPAAGEYRVYVVDQAHADSLSDPDYRDAHAKDFPPVIVTEGDNPPLMLHWPAK